MKSSTTVYDVAKKAGVSVATVSRVLNRQPNVRPMTADRVLRVMRELEYAPRTLVALTGPDRRLAVQITVPDMRNPFFSEVVQWTSLAARSIGCELSVAVIPEDADDAWRSRLRKVKAGALDGLLVCTSSRNSDHLARLALEGLPFVLIGWDMESAAFSSVVTDDQRGGVLAAQHFVLEGHKRVAIMTEDMKWKSSQDRVQGFATTLAQFGIHAFQHLVSKDPLVESGYHVAMDHLDPRHHPTAIFAATDSLALGVLRYAYEKGIKVPDDLSIIGYDGTVLATLATPTLSTIRQPLQEMSRIALDTLTDLVGHPGVLPRKVVLPPELVLRGTTRLAG